MTKETFFVFLKAAMTAVGAYLVGQNLLGNKIDQSILEGLTGVVLAVGSIGWSIFDKTYTTEMITSTARQAFIFVGGLLISSGKLTEGQLNGWLGLLLPIAAIIQSYFQKKQVSKVQSGEIDADKLKSIPVDKK